MVTLDKQTGNSQEADSQNKSEKCHFWGAN